LLLLDADLMLKWLWNMWSLSNDIDRGGLLGCFFFLRGIEWCNRFHLETVRTKRNHKMGHTTARFSSSSSSYTTACFFGSIARRVKYHQIISYKPQISLTLLVFFTHFTYPDESKPCIVRFPFSTATCPYVLLLVTPYSFQETSDVVGVTTHLAHGGQHGRAREVRGREGQVRCTGLRFSFPQPCP
jgi:hypothetical protein